MKVQNMNEPLSDVAEPIATMAVKAAPPVAVVSAHAAGITVPEAIQYVTLLYVSLLTLHKLWHMWKELRTGKPMPESEGELP